MTFAITLSTTAPVNQNAKVSALYGTDGKTGYTDNLVRIVSPTEGRFERWGNWKEYDDWLANVAPQATRLGRSAAIQSMGIGKTIDVPVVVHNWSSRPQSGAVSLDLPANFSADATSKPYSGLAAGAETTVTFKVTNTDTTLPAQRRLPVVRRHAGRAARPRRLRRTCRTPT